MLYLRFSQNINKDIENECSYHYTGLSKSDCEIEEVASACNIDIEEIEYNEDARQYVQILPGLCAFELESESIEDAVEEAENFYFNSVYNTKSMTCFHILEGHYVDDCPEGVLIDNVKLLFSNN